MGTGRVRLVAGIAVAAVVAAIVGLGLPGPHEAHAGTTLTANGPQGLDLDQAFTLTKGQPTSVIGYVEGGINWHLAEAQGLKDVIYVNWHETPVPCTTIGCPRVYSTNEADYDTNHDGVVNAADWAGDPRVTDANKNGYLDPEDLIAAFSDGIDHDHNGFADDISGWDFYDNQNDPQTVDAAYTHSDDQMLDAHAQCPKCLIMPVKAGEEALDDTDVLAQAWLYAGQMHVSVVTSVTADLGFSAYMRQTVDYLAAHGVAMVESSNDFDSTDHQGGMFWPGVVPGNGALADQQGTKWIRANETSWGTHNIFSVAGQGSTSGSTAAMGGLIGLLMSYGQQEYAAGKIARPLTGQAAVQVLRETSVPITDTTEAWPGAPGDWSLQYGYGIPNLYHAMQAVAAGKIPPATNIISPDWYALFDPEHVGSVPVSARVDAAPGQKWTYRLQVGIGGEPASFTDMATGAHTGAFSGGIGSLLLSKVPKSFWTAPMTVSKSKELETSEQYAVTVRLLVTDSAGHVGADRRAINVHHDPTLVGGTAIKLAASGESQPALVDLTGTGHEDYVFGTSDGLVHAIDPVTRTELPGWPVATLPTAVHHRYPGVDPGHEAVVADVAVGDLFHTGHLDVVVTSLAGHVYAWDAAGHELPGWPKTLDDGAVTPAIPRPAMPYTRQPHQGAVASPVLVDLDGNGQLDVVQAAWDGHIHAYQPAGGEVAGWPVKVTLPAGTTVPNGYDLIDDHKLDSTPAVAYFDGQGGKPTLVERSQYSETMGAGIQPLGMGWTFAYTSDGALRSGWPVKLPSIIEYYSSAQEFITEGSSSAVAADVTGSRLLPDEIAVSPVFAPPYLVNGAGVVQATYAPASTGFGNLEALLKPGASLPVLTSQTPDTDIAFTTSGSFGKLGGVLRFGQTESGALSLILSELEGNSGNAISEQESIYPAAGGVALDTPATAGQGLDFLGSPAFADVDGSGLGAMIAGGDSGAVLGVNALGQTAAGFPKATTGWVLFAPSTGDLLGNGATDVVAVAREGYLFSWETSGKASGNNEWWRWQHDERNSGNYETVARPPGAVRGLTWSPGQKTATFTAPGSTFSDGPAPTYRLTVGGETTTVTGSAAPGATQSLAIPASATTISVQAVNAAGLLGLPASAPGMVTGPTSGSTGGPTTEPPAAGATSTAPTSTTASRDDLAFTGLNAGVPALAAVLALSGAGGLALRRRRSA